MNFSKFENMINHEKININIRFLCAGSSYGVPESGGGLSLVELLGQRSVG